VGCVLTSVGVLIIWVLVRVFNMLNDHCHRVSTHLQSINIIIIIIYCFELFVLSFGIVSFMYIYSYLFCLY